MDRQGAPVKLLRVLKAMGGGGVVAVDQKTSDQVAFASMHIPSIVLAASGFWSAGCLAELSGSASPLCWCLQRISGSGLGAHQSRAKANTPFTLSQSLEWDKFHGFQCVPTWKPNLNKF